MFQACVLDFGGQWEQNLVLTEFAYHNHYYLSTKMSLFEGLNVRQYHSSVVWFETFEIRPLYNLGQPKAFY